MSPILRPGWDSATTFPAATTRQARYGIAYFETLCAQVGVGFTETRPDADVQGIDGHLSFDSTMVHVQVKCTTQSPTKNDPHFTWTLKPSWVAGWARKTSPVYLVLVHVPKSPLDWVSYPDAPATTCHSTAAYWARVDKLPVGATSVSVPCTNRLTAATISQWESSRLAGFTGGGTL